MRSSWCDGGNDVGFLLKLEEDVIGRVNQVLAL